MSAGSVRAAKAHVEIGVSNRLQAGLAKAGAQIEAFAKKMKKIGAGIQSVGMKAAVTGGIASYGIGLMTRGFAQFDDQMRIVKAVTGSTAAEFAALTDEAKRLGRETSFTATQVSEGMVELGRAGFKPGEIMNATESILALARATATDLPRATEIAGAALRGFGMDSSRMGDVADILTKTTNSSAQTLEELFESMKYVAPVARTAGANIADVGAMLGIMADNGIKGSLAGTALRRAFINLSSPKTVEMLNSIGVSAKDANGNLRPLMAVIKDIDEATKGSGSADRVAVFSELFERGVAGAIKLAEQADRVEDLRLALVNAGGTAVDVATDMDSGIGGAFRKMFSALEGSQIAFGEATQSLIGGAALAVRDFANVLTKILERNPQIATGFVKIAAGVLGAGIAMLALAQAFKLAAFLAGILAAVMKGIGVLIGGITVGIKVMTATLLAFNPITLALGAAIAALITLWSVFSDSLRNSFGHIAAEWANTGQMMINSWHGIVDAVMAGDLSLAAEIAWVGVQLVWENAMFTLKSIWTDWVYDLAGAFVVIEESIGAVFYKALEWIVWFVRKAAELLGADSLAAELQFTEDGLAMLAGSAGESERQRIGVLENEREKEQFRNLGRVGSLNSELDDLIRRAAAKREEVESKEITVLTSPGGSTVIDLEQLMDEGPALPETEGDKTTSRGTFSAIVAQRTATNTLEVAREQVRFLAAILSALKHQQAGWTP